jgi:hypothetical protein
MPFGGKCDSLPIRNEARGWLQEHMKYNQTFVSSQLHAIHHQQVLQPHNSKKGMGAIPRKQSDAKTKKSEKVSIGEQYSTTQNSTVELSRVQ